MKLNQSLFRETPESLDTIDIDFTRSKVLLMVDLDMTVSTEHKRVVTPELVSIDDASPSHRFDSEVQESFCCDILQNFDLYDPISFENAEHGHFIGGSTASWALSTASEVALVHLDFTTEKLRAIRDMCQDSHTDRVHCFQNSGIAQRQLLCDPPGRELYFKELDDPQPLCAGDVDSIDPATREVMELVATMPATVSFICDFVDVAAATSTAETTVVFPT
jgi:hypothetical protein